MKSEWMVAPRVRNVDKDPYVAIKRHLEEMAGHLRTRKQIADSLRIPVRKVNAVLEGMEREGMAVHDAAGWRIA